MRQYRIEDFGRASHRDTFVSAVGATALLAATWAAARRVPECLAEQDKIVSLICGILMISGFAWYVTEYYAHIWAPFYALPEDKAFFRFYALGMGFSLAALMPQWPEYWYLYLFVLFTALYFKKRRTRNLFRRAFSLRYPDPSGCDDLTLLARLKLSDAFTRLWLRNGCIVNGMYSLVLFFLARADARLRLGVVQVSPFTLVSIFVTVASLSVWSRKATSHLARMRERVEAGDHAYIEDMEF